MEELFSLLEETYYYPEYIGDDVFGRRWFRVYDSLTIGTPYYVCPEVDMRLWDELPWDVTM